MPLGSRSLPLLPVPLRNADLTVVLAPSIAETPSGAKVSPLSEVVAGAITSFGCFGAQQERSPTMMRARRKKKMMEEKGWLDRLAM